ncbi:uncharacterized protein LOC121595498 [Anopheles merus]|uniref:uncharacterized protein LOC121595498 n=1 Tax=Anopheles merus TaxID=30066 RepID=UPI001BE437FB|nr:uncharacterized protein LOC121595498 [Anopheles merus]
MDRPSRRSERQKRREKYFSVVRFECACAVCVYVCVHGVWTEEVRQFFGSGANSASSLSLEFSRYEPTPISFPGQHAKPAACQHHKRATATGTSSKRTYAHNRHRLHCFIQNNNLCARNYNQTAVSLIKIGPPGNSVFSCVEKGNGKPPLRRLN